VPTSTPRFEVPPRGGAQRVPRSLEVGPLQGGLLTRRQDHRKRGSDGPHARWFRVAGRDRTTDPPLSRRVAGVHGDGDSRVVPPGAVGRGSDPRWTPELTRHQRVVQLSDVVQLAVRGSHHLATTSEPSRAPLSMQPSKYGGFRVARGGIEPPTYRFSGRRPIVRCCPKSRICWEFAPSVSASEPPGMTRWLPPWLPRRDHDHLMLISAVGCLTRPSSTATERLSRRGHCGDTPSALRRDSVGCLSCRLDAALRSAATSNADRRAMERDPLRR